MAIIVPDDLASYLEVELTDSIEAKVTLANDIVEELGFTAPFSARVRAITLEVAARAVRNPNGYAQEQIDDYKYTRDRDTRQAGVYLTEAERAELLGLVGGGPTYAAYSIPLGGADYWP